MLSTRARIITLVSLRPEARAYGDDCGTGLSSSASIPHSFPGWRPQHTSCISILRHLDSSNPFPSCLLSLLLDRSRNAKFHSMWKE